MKVALVKQDVYPDLYVCPTGLTPKETLFSSFGRVGPVGLFTLLGADFYIIKEEFTPECQIWKRVIPGTEDKYRQLKYKSINKIDEFKGFEAKHDYSNGDFAINCRDIQWSNYDVVISINCSIPTAIVQSYPQVLWAYMISEANIFSDKVYFGYDACLNQEIKGIAYDHVGVLDFPYTFVGPNCLEKILFQHLNRPSLKKGVFAEINTTTERPVKEVPHFIPILQKAGHSIITHKQLILDNLQAVYDAKYFVKVGGRMIRGNSVIEAVSLGTLVLMNPLDLGSSQILPKDAWVYNIDEGIEKIKYLDQHPGEYSNLLQKQRELLQQFVVDYPLRSLEHSLDRKRKNPIVRKAESISRALIKSKIKRLLTS